MKKKFYDVVFGFRSKEVNSLILRDDITKNSQEAIDNRRNGYEGKERKEQKKVETDKDREEWRWRRAQKAPNLF